MHRIRYFGVALAVAVVTQSSSGASPDGNRSVLSRPELIELTLEAPFQDLFAHARSDDDYTVKGRLTAGEGRSGTKVEVPDVTIGLRGHTSRNATECEFPKLKLTLPDDQPDGSPFEGVQSLKIGTHCGNRDDAALTSKYGRLANDKAPQREAMVYRMLAAVGVATLQARPARITYAFSDERAQTGTSPVTRNAFLLEDDDALVKRVGGTGQITEDRFDSAKERFDVRDTARLAFAEAMIGNFDWCLRFYPGDRYRCDDRHPVWNILAVVRGSGPALPAIYDFDLSGPVVGRHIWFNQVYSTDFVPTGSAVDVEVLGQLQRTRSLFDRQILDETRAEFSRNKAAVYQAVADAVVDDEGRSHARAYLDSFYRIVDDDARFYRPVVVAESTRAFVDAEGTRPACGAASEIPVGTVVSDPIETRGEKIQVRVLDTFWKWTDPARCNVIHRQPVWIASDSVGADYPR
jgi:hypothetical protein